MLFEPLQLRNITLQNRIVAAPLASASSLPDGAPSEKTLSIYQRFSASGVSLAVTEHHGVNTSAVSRATQLRADSDEVCEKLSAMRKIFTAAGVPTIAQINHAGGRPASAEVFDLPGYRPVSPSGVKLGDQWQGRAAQCDALSTQEVKGIVEDFVAAAVRLVKISGYDGVQIHCAHGYLLGQFLSPLTNLRSDEYGGSDKKRARILYEITDAIRQSLPDAVVSFRLGVADTFPDEPRKGLSLDETIPVAKELANLGVDILSLSGNHCGYGIGRYDEAYFAPYAARIKSAVGDAVPVDCTGGIQRAEVAGKLLREKVCDLVGVGRLMLRDPNFLDGWRR